MSDNESPDQKALGKRVTFTDEAVRSAMETYKNNPERAVRYLVGGSYFYANTDDYNAESSDYDDTNATFHMFRSNPLARNLQQLIYREPSVLDETVTTLLQRDPSLIKLINWNQAEFFRMLVETDIDDGDEDGSDVSK